MSSNGSVLVACGADAGHQSRGECTIYERSVANAYVYSQTLSDNAATKNFRFGTSLDISSSGEVLVVGSQRADLEGHVSVFLRQANGQYAFSKHLYMSTGSAGVELARYGLQVSGDGQYVVAGAPRYDSGSTDTGAVFHFRLSDSGSDEMQMLVASNKAANDFFGWNVAMSRDGEVLAVGAPGVHANDYGALYVYTRSASTEDFEGEVFLQASDKANGDKLGEGGIAISADGSVIAAGVIYRTASGQSQGGVVKVFEYSTSWSDAHTLTYTTPAASDHFGVALTMSADSLFIVACGPAINDGGTSNVGKCDAFQYGGSSYAKSGSTLVASPVSANDQYGSGVQAAAMSDDGVFFVVGAPDHASNNVGAIAIFNSV